MEPQVPKSDHPKSPGSTNTLSAFSIMAKSIEILTQRTNAPEMNLASPFELYTSAPSLNTSFISVWYFWNAFITALADQMKMPAFQRKSPLCRNVVASSRFGFSVNVFTFRSEEHTYELQLLMSY